MIGIFYILDYAIFRKIRNMKTRLGVRVNNALESLLSFKGIDAATLQFKKTTWLTTLGISLFVTAMFIPVLYFQVKSLLLFGILLFCVYIPSLILMVLLPYRRKWMVHVSQHLTLLITFYIIVKLGGLHNSGGIILAGLSMVISSVMFYSTSWSIWYIYLLHHVHVCGGWNSDEI